jgi:uncharacterized protein YjiS (DUF1127 family)
LQARQYIHYLKGSGGLPPRMIGANFMTHDHQIAPSQGLATALSTGPGLAHTTPMRAVLRLETLLAWVVRSRQRRALAELDARLLQDAGISPAAAKAEAARPFWR